MKTVNADELREKVNILSTLGNNEIMKTFCQCIIDLIDSMPNEGEVDAVRCKDCKYHGYDEEYDYWWCNRMLGGFRTEPDDFCSHGKREDNAT